MASCVQTLSNFVWFISVVCLCKCRFFALFANVVIIVGNPTQTTLFGSRSWSDMFVWIVKSMPPTHFRKFNAPMMTRLVYDDMHSSFASLGSMKDNVLFFGRLFETLCKWVEQTDMLTILPPWSFWRRACLNYMCCRVDQNWKMRSLCPTKYWYPSQHSITTTLINSLILSNVHGNPSTPLHHSLGVFLWNVAIGDIWKGVGVSKDSTQVG